MIFFLKYEDCFDVLAHVYFFKVFDETKETERRRKQGYKERPRKEDSEFQTGPLKNQ